MGRNASASYIGDFDCDLCRQCVQIYQVGVGDDLGSSSCACMVYIRRDSYRERPQNRKTC